jgi:cytochrome c oxidase subunit 2
MTMRLLYLAAGAIGIAALSSRAEAAPEPWEMLLQPGVTPVADMIHNFNAGLLVIIGLIAAFVLVLLAWVMIRYNSRTNPVPSRTSHNTLIEVIWTVVPVLILVAIAVPSFSLLFAQYNPARAISGYDPERDRTITIKATGVQWYWTYEYPDNGDVSIDSLMLQDSERTDPETQPRLLAVNNPLVLPVGVVIRMQVTAADVIHSWAMQPFGVKTDAVPGRLNEAWFRADKEGVYYGQCSELCGRDHAFMPIEVLVVSEAQFDAWVAAAANDLQGAYRELRASIDTARDGKAIASR